MADRVGVIVLQRGPTSLQWFFPFYATLLVIKKIHFLVPIGQRVVITNLHTIYQSAWMLETFNLEWSQIEEQKESPHIR